MVAARTLDGLRRSALARDPGGPVIIWYGPERARIELSGATLANAAAKTANLLGEELEPGDLIRIELPLHWQLPVWLAACAAGGWPVEVGDPTGQAALVVTDPTGSRGTAGRLAVVSLDPFGRPVGDVPAGAIDVAAEARAQPDHFSPDRAPQADAPALLVGGRTWTSAQLVTEAETSAQSWGLEAGDRFTTERPPADLLGVLATLWTPLAAAATVVLLGPGVAAAGAAQERPVHHVA